LCYETATWNPTTCIWDVTGTQPVAPTVLCYQTATWNPTTCVWDVTGTQPVAPTVLCYQTATWNATTCIWDVTGTQPVAPTVLCYQTATWNPTTCVWDVTGTQPVAPTVLCYQTATWNPTTCIWDVTGTQPVAPTVLCYQTATWNPTTCIWDVTGTQPVAPMGLACYQTATWNPTTCIWDITGTVPLVSIFSTLSTINMLGSSDLSAIGSPSGGTYSWSPASSLNSSTSPNVTATPNTTTTYTVTYDIGNGCTATNTTTIIVNLLTVSVNSPTICSGDNATLTATPSVPGGTYLWSPGGATTSSITVNPTTNIVYSVIYTLNGVSSPSSQGTITVNPTPTVTVNNPTICSGSNVSLTAVGSPNGGTYLWSPGGQSTASITVNPTTTTTYSVNYTLNGCIGTATSNVTVNSIPTVSVAGTIICAGQNATLTATPSAAGGTYLWNNSQQTNSITVNPIVTTSYTVMYSLNGCNATGTGVVTVNPIPTVVLSNATICAGDNTTLTATGSPAGGTYAWTGSANTASTLTISPVSTTTYLVTYTVNGCTSNAATGIVTVNPIPTVTVTNPSICEGQSATISATPSQNGGTYLWTPAGQTTSSIQVSPNVTTTYGVQYQVNGCTSAIATSTVTVNTTPGLTFDADQLTGCAPLSVNFTNTSASAGSSSTNVWSLGNGAQLNGNSVNYLFTAGGCYDITLTSTVGGCVGTTTIQDFICVENPPVAAFQTNTGIFTSPTQTVTFINNSVGAVTYSWDFGDGNTSIETNPIHLYGNTSNGYLITLTATSNSGCVDSYDLAIEYQEEEIFYIPNTFTPDGDNFNQTFQPIFTAGFDPFNFEMYIFNRWGELIFESHDANIGWDGSYSNLARTVQTGVYSYKIIYKNPRIDERKIVAGHVTLIR
jgi:gliding motility-associated-like protein